MGVDDSGGSDTRIETTDKPTPQEQPSAPPPDNPGSPGQPSRLESLARAREQQEARAQDTQDKDAGSSPREDREGKATTEQNGSGSEKAEASGTTEAEDEPREDDEKPGRHDRRGEQPRSLDEGTTDAREPDSGTPGDRDRPQARTAEQRTEPADRPAPSEKRWTPPPDNPGSPGQPSRLESLARARELQQERNAQRTESTDTASPPTEPRDIQPTTPQSESDGVKAEPAGIPEGTRTEQGSKPTDDARRPATETTDQPTSPQEPRPGSSTGELDPQERTTDPPPAAEHGPQAPGESASGTDQPRPGSAEQATPPDGGDQPHPTDTRAKPGDNPTGQYTEATGPAPDTGTRTDQPGEPSTDNTPTSEEPNRDQETTQHAGDRDKKSEQAENSQPEGYISPDFTSYNSEDGRTYYTVPLEELSRNSDNTDQTTGELEEANEERSPYAMTLDEFNRASLNPTDTDVEPGVAARPPDRREQTDNDSESRIDRARRATWMRGGDLKDAGKALSDTVNGILGPRPPTPAGRSETGTGPYITPSNAKGATPDAFVATATAAMLAIEGVRKAKQVGSQLAYRIRGRNNDSNG